MKEIKRLITSIIIIALGSIVFVILHDLGNYIYISFFETRRIVGVGLGIAIELYSRILFVLIFLSVFYQVFFKQKRYFQFILLLIFCLCLIIGKLFLAHPLRTIHLILCAMISLSLVQFLITKANRYFLSQK